MKPIIHFGTASTPMNYGCNQVPFPEQEKITRRSEDVSCKNCRALLDGKPLGKKRNPAALRGHAVLMDGKLSNLRVGHGSPSSLRAVRRAEKVMPVSGPASCPASGRAD